jgi:hypothetical protein
VVYGWTEDAKAGQNQQLGVTTILENIYVCVALFASTRNNKKSTTTLSYDKNSKQGSCSKNYLCDKTTNRPDKIGLPLYSAEALVSCSPPKILSTPLSTG